MANVICSKILTFRDGPAWAIAGPAPRPGGALAAGKRRNEEAEPRRVRPRHAAHTAGSQSERAEIRLSTHDTTFQLPILRDAACTLESHPPSRPGRPTDGVRGLMGRSG
ncbi:hypothetical protein Airi01_064450 [Actinoallomurus iriomotensis]|uniref:Uncharacterized protein n=1 Tax=Actinoallomurus iriomotensis TaxID=478107 RepID=A0A9W6RM27_9ACTN|nr:hypothetical protein Airi01_064450 [Actinoallomurus iriomotensis]